MTTMIFRFLNELLQKKKAQKFYKKLVSCRVTKLPDHWEKLRNKSYYDINLSITECYDNPNCQKTYDIEGYNPGEYERSYFGKLYIDDKKAEWQIGLTRQVQWGEVDSYKDVVRIHFHYKEDKVVYNGIVLYRWISEDELLGFWIEEHVDEVGIEKLCISL